MAVFSFYLFGILAVIFCLKYPHKLTDRVRNAISSGTLLAMGWLAVYVLAKAFGLVHIVVAVPVILGSAVFALGYLAPKALRRPVESWIMPRLHILELLVSETTQPWIRRARFVLEWLGLGV